MYLRYLREVTVDRPSPSLISVSGIFMPTLARMKPRTVSSVVLFILPGFGTPATVC